MKESSECIRSSLKRKNIYWYHGTISREETEKLLKGHPTGSYLIRYSNSTQKYVLSLISSNQFYHYPIEELSDGFYQVNGTTSKFLGIDLLVSEFKRNNNCIVCSLNSPIPGSKAPAHITVYGTTSEIHVAIRKGNFKQVKDLIFKMKNLPNCNLKEYINEKSADSGASPLIEAAKFLLENGALANVRDCGGFTALHRACQKSFAHVAETLLKGASLTSSRSNPQIKCPFTGNTPLHEASQLGHLDCVNTLLKYRAAPWSRNFDDEMPFELASRYGFEELSCALAGYKMPNPSTDKNDWYHPDLSREESEKIFSKKAVQKDGTFLIRNSSQSDRKFVLVIWCTDQLLKYQINVINFPFQSETNEAFFIERGPFHPSLELLVEHYSSFPDGIPTKLRFAISAKGHLISIDKKMSMCQANSAKSAEIFQLLNNFEGQVNANQNNSIIDMSLKLKNKMKKISNGITMSSSSGVSMTTASSSQCAFSPNIITNMSGNDSGLDNSVLNSPSEIRMIPSNDVTLFFRLGEGEFGEVYRGKLKSSKENSTQDVAVKVLVQPSQRLDFLKEASIMMKLQHPQIITIHGVCENKRLMMILELAENGSLLDYLLDYPEKCQIFDLYNWAMQIASGMSYLESYGFVHRDLACRNVLLSNSTCAKISDFGLSRAVLMDCDYYKATQRGKWPVKWYAPESIYYKTFSHASDVWSFGVCLWEMFSLGEHPYSDMDSIEVLRQIEEGNRLPRPELASDDVFAIMHDCWAYNPEARPTFHQLLTMFKHLTNNVYENVNMSYPDNNNTVDDSQIILNTSKKFESVSSTSSSKGTPIMALDT